jgi:16S rRNA processing protein RimM
VQTRLVQVGVVGRPHGLDGSFVVERASEAPERFAVGALVRLDGEPAEVVSAKRVGGGRLAIRLDRPARRGAPLEVLREELPPPDEDAWYVIDLVGLAVEEEGGRPLGRVADVEPGLANDVLLLDSGLALPFVDACVSDVDLDAGRILVAAGFTDAG